MTTQIVPLLFGALSGLTIFILYHQQRSTLHSQITEQRTLFNTIIDNSLTGFLLIDSRHGTIVSINETAAAMLDFHPEELIGRPCDSICALRQSGYCPLNQLHLEPVCNEAVLLSRSGDPLHVRQSVSRVALNGSRLVVKTFFNISEEQEAEQLADTVLDSLQTRIAVINPQGTIIKVNESWRHFAEETRAGKEALWGVGANYFDILRTESLTDDEEIGKAKQLLDGLRALCEQKLPYFEQEHARVSDRQSSWFSLRATPLRGKEGHAVITHVDITALKRAEMEVTERKQQMEFIINAARIGTWDLFPQKNCARFNTIWAETLGFRPEEIPSTVSFARERIHPDDRHLVDSLMKNYLTGNSEFFSCRFRVQHKSGEWRWIFSQGRIVEQSKEGETVRITGIQIDITEEQEHYRTLKRLEEAVNHSASGVVITDGEGRISYSNPAFSSGSGYDGNKLLGHHLRSFCEENDDDFPLNRRDLTTTGFSWNGRLHLRHHNGGIRTHETSITPIYDDLGLPASFVVVMLDVSHNLELESQLDQARRMESIGQLVGGIAHDFNNMLSPIIGYCDLLRKKPLDDTALHMLRQIRTAAVHSRDLIKQLLTYAKKQDLNITPLCPRKVISAMSELLRRTLPDNIALTTSISAPVGLLLADERQLHHVLLNLVVNARDAMPEGGTITISVEQETLDCGFCVEHPECNPGHYCTVKVGDEGQGMDEQTRHQIFEPFFTTKGDAGTGLGLATVYRIVRQHHGYITVDSRPGKGSTFTLYLPLSKEAGHLSGTAKEKEKSTTAEKATILLIDDNEQVRQVVGSMLESSGFTVHARENAGDALRYLDTDGGGTDLIITDFDMPRLNGMELVSRLRQSRPQLAVLLISGHLGALPTNDEALQPHFFLRKPFTLSELLSLVDQGIHHTRQEMER